VVRVGRRIEIELTSSRPDGTWTWRAAGARQPKGVLDVGLAPEGAKPGDVLRVEADFELEGIVVTSVLASKEAPKVDPGRIEIIGSASADQPGVTTQLVGKAARRPRGNDRSPASFSGGRGPERPGSAPDRTPSGPRRSQGGHSQGVSDGQAGRSGAGRSGPQHGTGDDSRRPGGSQPNAPRRGPSEVTAGSRRGADRLQQGGAEPAATRGAPRRASNRLNPAMRHRKAVIDSLPPEQHPIAEELLRGGIPALRAALHLEREKAVAEGRVPPNTDELLALAERLLPGLRAATWKDRADAALASAETVSLRDLRSVLASADVARDEESRTAVASLSEVLDRRLAKAKEVWLAEIAGLLDDGKVVRALRVSARTPDPSLSLDAALAERLTEAASAALSPATRSDVWVAVMEAAAESPVRRAVAPSGLPETASPELRKAAHQMSGRIPGLARLLGVTIPPPPRPASQRNEPKASAPLPAGA